MLSPNYARQHLEHSLTLIEERKRRAVRARALLVSGRALNGIQKRALEVGLREEVPAINASEKVLHEVIEAHNRRCAKMRQGYHQIELEKR